VIVPSRDALIVRVAKLLREAGEAHHRAFSATNGEDSEWPLWYAGYVQEGLEKLLGAAMTKSELVYLLVAAEKDHALRNPRADWPAYYAEFVVSACREDARRRSAP
jgi:hypothetical protein